MCEARRIVDYPKVSPGGFCPVTSERVKTSREPVPRHSAQTRECCEMLDGVIGPAVHAGLSATLIDQDMDRGK